MRPTPLLSISRSLPALNAPATSTSAAPSPFTVAHKSYVKSLYKRYLTNELNWCIRRDVWRDRAIEIRAEFERNRYIRNPRELARVLEAAEERLKDIAHPDPYKPPMGEDGTKWERNIPPRMFTEAEKREAIDNQHF
ncbi:hypothetical protein BCV69DRAFT_282436 [Microstroma glucosiphilum]|uniref:NADH dehydrogenase [ubiquinone] 1 beta subcomplex subunit 9 n=1 Tax=Pseudomicrostroma glucosiphilum TaxID=1684307 RepID=A0A316U7V0_9BASI|nr:hypothetical protein BCV69DRAFT_282436 [Pseudomicrostroma glucosiphilum]PWN20924.1 hypothetical protein BCV69DRAFT_282436 [Pseudomicrostroma glucosiphilum]